MRPSELRIASCALASATLLLSTRICSTFSSLALSAQPAADSAALPCSSASFASAASLAAAASCSEEHQASHPDLHDSAESVRLQGSSDLGFLLGGVSGALQGRDLLIFCLQSPLCYERNSSTVMRSLHGEKYEGRSAHLHFILELCLRCRERILLLSKLDP
jgi:hypothetical protein